MEFWIKAAQLIASLSILVVLHELGHFIPAKYFKTRVEKFYLFFNPGFSLFKIKRGDTEYGIGWLPLGGYVKIAGMVDESMDTSQMSQEPQEWEFRAKPAWQRLIIMVGGVTVNLILGVLIYTMLLFVWGEKRLPIEELHSGIWCVSPVAREIGFENGDRIVSIRGEKPIYMEEVVPSIIYGGEIIVDRNGEEVKLDMPENLVEQMTDSKIKGLFFPRVPFLIDLVPDSSINAKAGLLQKDQIIRIDSTDIAWFDQGKTVLKGYSGSQVPVTILRDGNEMQLTLSVSDSGLVEIQPLLLDYKDMEKAGIYKFETLEYGFFESIPAGISKAWGKLKGYVEQFKLIFNPDTGAYKSLGGFGRIGGMFPPTWEWQAFWEITAILSLILAFMNILPIPALDGGHVMFLLYEMIRGKAPNQKFLEKAQVVGMILLLALLLYANGNDIYRYLIGKF